MRLRDEGNPHYDPAFYGCDNRGFRRDIIDFRKPRTAEEKKAVLLDSVGRVLNYALQAAAFVFFVLGHMVLLLDGEMATLLFAVWLLCFGSGLGFRGLMRSWAVLVKNK